MNLNDPIIKKLLSLNLPSEDYAVFGSGPMFAYGIKDLGHDVDLIARGKAWKKALTLGEVSKAKSGDNVVTLFDGEIEIFDGWAPGTWDTDALIDTAKVINGIRFVSLENVIKWKKEMGREKDLQHIQIIEDYLAQNKK